MFRWTQYTSRLLGFGARRTHLVRMPMPLILAKFSVYEGAANAKSKEEMKTLAESDKVVLFMKGNSRQPLCGYSSLVVKILDLHGIRYKTYNVLEDPAVRQGIKDYSDWPTIPQLYVNGKFVGGSDILLAMHQNGELVDFFSSEGLQSRLAEDEQQ